MRWCWMREEVQRFQGSGVQRSKGPKDQDISNSHSNTSLTLMKVHLVCILIHDLIWVISFNHFNVYPGLAMYSSSLHSQLTPSSIFWVTPDLGSPGPDLPFPRKMSGYKWRQIHLSLRYVRCVLLMWNWIEG